MERTTCCIVGGGPAGMVLGLLLARAGVPVTVLEKHGDFLRDFRGDTVHPTTLQLLDDLGLSERFAQLPQRRLDRVGVPLGPDGEFFTFGDFTTLPTKYNYIAMVPQWDFLDLLADAGAQEHSFTLRMNTEVTEPIREHGRINGVRYRTGDGATGEIRAPITVACDGRKSFARGLPELRLRDFPTPMDVRWFKVPRHPEDPAGGIGLIRGRTFMTLLDRGDYFQIASIIAKDTDAAGRSQPIEQFNRTLAEHLPWLDDERELVRDWEDVKLLHVTLDRLRKWHVPGLLCLGDAAHAMSPVGGIGINLAVQDAVAAARHLAEPLREGRLRRRHVAAVQRRRLPTTVLVQRLQRVIHDNVVEPALHGEIDFGERARIPRPLKALTKMPWLRRIPPYVLAYGAMRERPPAAALR
ncbi:2-polyprenyl-6-methoxyphenol hydroxylase-like FAD-dependent oxidoreductase [Halopolyspora algeriensis]|uniref:2-polyprenyl-6-methoxyphenol hydroxylase-like FAD-dependent oxidoreductase n=1 Tax=Halopolyspora algeriensis TaxID=1500506 RepID=A0A368VDG7_9ACTN|nr:FAD-dependent oxidoreductase [Halopolyspora algeriensis]RCW39146.1 2-polyprenyl-6-methoxyphenol hydroxylase-like FAD-dependent oxidoreductase [Halopolyspora algeriensis]TQM56557.1 2-polyprenyl-6-methoxyphenol hydroxylase-like FAD-dependent oxidoreductase [Halopolyspora algeriensis]